jgi:hypothetical protein
VIKTFFVKETLRLFGFLKWADRFRQTQPRSEVGRSRGPAIPQIASPITGNAKINNAHLSFIREFLLVCKMLTIAHKSVKKVILAKMKNNIGTFMASP